MDSDRLTSRLVNLETDLSRFSRQIKDVEQARMSDYRSLMRRINKVEDSMMDCCLKDQPREIDGGGVNNNNKFTTTTTTTRRTTTTTRRRFTSDTTTKQPSTTGNALMLGVK